MKEEGLDPEDVANLLMVIMLGGVFGAKLYYAVSFYLIYGDPFWQSMFSRGGLVLRRLIGGGPAGYAGCKYWRVPPIPLANAACISLAVGQAIGRVGCFLVGDDYGKASDLPWAVAFRTDCRRSLPGPSTMLYETVWLLLGAGFLWQRRERVADGRVPDQRHWPLRNRVLAPERAGRPGPLRSPVHRHGPRRVRHRPDRPRAKAGRDAVAAAA